MFDTHRIKVLRVLALFHLNYPKLEPRRTGIKHPDDDPAPGHTTPPSDNPPNAPPACSMPHSQSRYKRMTSYLVLVAGTEKAQP